MIVYKKKDGQTTCENIQKRKNINWSILNDNTRRESEPKNTGLFESERKVKMMFGKV